MAPCLDKPLPDEAIHGTADCREAFRDLILDDRMQNGMGFQIGHLDAYGTVIVLRTLDSAAHPAPAILPASALGRS